MIILPEQAKVVLGPPKCATTSLHYDLVRPPWLGFQIDPDAQHDFQVPEQYEHFQIIAPVRDPYERATSLYWHYLRDVRRERGIEQGLAPKKWRAIPIPENEISFVFYMEMVMRGELLHIARSNYLFFTNTVSDWLDNAPRVDAFIHVEDLETDWAVLVGAEWGEIQFSTRNAPGREPWEKYQSDRAVKLVDEWAREDFLRYGYDHQTCARP